ncbi:MAG: proteobacterial dedicated sortase system response regulator [Burkholderiales bacterium]|nr:proteobacterial dedicated sortase system response regulator [Burkholderiales bacterium]MDP2397126.1 proteobacterial dedicated sortase system response regulator [Burkholderiales bacterium]
MAKNYGKAVAGPLRRQRCGIVSATIMAQRIAIIEDDPAIGANYADALSAHGYAVQLYADRASATTGLQASLPDLVLLDIGLGSEPDAGFALCRELRNQSATLPIIFLTARDNEFDMVAGLRLGADDYVTKSVSLPHLLARVAALFRRAALGTAAEGAEDTLNRGALTIDLKRFTVRWNGRAVDLTLTEFWLVHALARHPGHVRNREQLMAEAHIVVDDSTITSHIKRMRRKFAAVDPHFARIDTVYGLGYRWRSAD